MSCSLSSNNQSLSSSNTSEELYKFFYYTQSGDYLGSSSNLSDSLELNSGGSANIFVVLSDYAHMTIYPPYVESTNFQANAKLPQCMDGVVDTDNLEFIPELMEYLGGVMPPVYEGDFSLPDGFTDPTPEERQLNFIPCKVWLFRDFKPIDASESSTFSIKNTGVFFADGSSPSIDFTGTINWDVLGGLTTLETYPQYTQKHDPNGTEITLTFQQGFRLYDEDLITIGNSCNMSISPNDNDFHTEFTITITPKIPTALSSCTLEFAEGAFVNSEDVSSLPISPIEIDWADRMFFTVEFPEDPVNKNPPVDPVSVIKKIPYGDLTWNGTNVMYEGVPYTPTTTKIEVNLIPTYRSIEEDKFELATGLIEFLDESNSTNVIVPDEEDFINIFDEDGESNKMTYYLNPIASFQHIIGDTAPIDLTFKLDFFTETLSYAGAEIEVGSQPTDQKSFSWSTLFDINNVLKGVDTGYTSGTTQIVRVILPLGSSVDTDLISTTCNSIQSATSVVGSNNMVFDIIVENLVDENCTVTFDKGAFIGINYDIKSQAIAPVEITFTGTT